MKTCETCGTNCVGAEYYWLIEADGSYWDGHFADSRGFTRDVYHALRFPRREDAETVKHWLLQAHSFALRTTQHGWVNGEQHR
jgi:hypothetical protein